MATTLYTVHERGGLEGEVEFVREGFSVWAFFLTFLWLWAHRAWLAGTAVFAALMLLGIGQNVIGIPLYLNMAIQLAINMGVGIFAHDFHRASLTRRGYVETGVATGSGVEEAEIRYFGKRAAQIEARHSAAPAIPA